MFFLLKKEVVWDISLREKKRNCKLHAQFKNLEMKMVLSFPLKWFVDAESYSELTAMLSWADACSVSF